MGALTCLSIKPTKITLKHMNKRPMFQRIPAVALMAAVGTSLAVVCYAADKPKHTIKEVMKELHKGDTAPFKKVAKGEGSKEDLAKFVEYYTDLTLQEPAKGDAKEWHAKTAKLLAATKALQAGKPGALDGFKEAANCKACHSAHKGD
jgi:cytochrome c556